MKTEEKIRNEIHRLEKLKSLCTNDIQCEMCEESIVTLKWVLDNE